MPCAAYTSRYLELTAGILHKIVNSEVFVRQKARENKCGKGLTQQNATIIYRPDRQPATNQSSALMAPNGIYAGRGRFTGDSAPLAYLTIVVHVTLVCWPRNGRAAWLIAIGPNFLNIWSDHSVILHCSMTRFLDRVHMRR